MGFLVAAYAIVWVGIFAYIGWIALRLRGTHAQLAAIDEVLREQEEHNEN